jgi:hypothetical protein
MAKPSDWTQWFKLMVKPSGYIHQLKLIAKLSNLN